MKKIVDNMLIENIVDMPEFGCQIGLCDDVLMSAPMNKDGQVEDEYWTEVIWDDYWGEIIGINHNFIAKANEKLNTDFSKEKMRQRP